MRIATWNINSLNVRLLHVLAWLEQEQPDVLALQEIKLLDGSSLIEEFKAQGYEAIFSGQKSYNGVAFLSRVVGTDVITDIDNLDDPQRRILAATFGDVRVVNLYVPNGRQVSSESYVYKLDWLTKVRDFLQAELLRSPKLVVVGDFNIAPADADVHDPQEWNGQILCSPAERSIYNEILNLGFSDCFRLHPQAEKSFSWWDYRLNGFKRNRGLRIDLILASGILAGLCHATKIDQGPRDWDRPSDHAPVIADFAT